jgi:hypothetical protein
MKPNDKVLDQILVKALILAGMIAFILVEVTK